MVQHLGVRAACVEHLQPLDKMHSLPSEPFGDMSVGFRPGLSGWKSCFNFLFTEGIVLELLGRLLAIDRRCKDIVKAELPRKDIHHDMNGALIMSIIFDSSLGRKPVQNVYRCKRGTACQKGRKHTNMAQAKVDKPSSVEGSPGVEHPTPDKRDVGWSEFCIVLAGTRGQGFHFVLDRR
jgi:hypothetical protein